MHLNPTLFREYDIRGRIDSPGELTADAITAIGRGFAAFLKRRNIEEVIVGHDARPSSKSVADLTVRALFDSGMRVIEIGAVLTPIFYFSQYHLKKKGGVMITASHNEQGWSGFKHAYDYATTFLPHDVQELYQIIEKEEFISGAGSRQVYFDIIEAYTNDVLSNIRCARRLRILVDAGNGTAGPIVPLILRRAGCEVIEQYTEVSETRHHQANPSNVGMLAAMTEGVRAGRVDLGLGFDEDGDRLGVVDEKGVIVWPDRVLALLARGALAKNPGGAVVFDVKCSEALVEDIKNHGGKPVVWKTGHSYIKAKAKETGAVLAGERSGHLFFPKEHYGFDDAVYGALKLLKYVGDESRPLSLLVADLPKYSTSPVWHASCPDTQKYEIVDALTRQFKEEYGADKVIEVNGARVYFDEGWGLVRASSNIPALVLVFEAKTGEGLKRIESIFRKKLAVFPEIGKDWVSG